MLPLALRTASKLSAIFIFAPLVADAAPLCQDLFVMHPMTLAVEHIIESSQTSLMKTGWKPSEGIGHPGIWRQDGPKGTLGTTPGYSPKHAYDSEFTAILAKTGVRRSYDFFDRFLRESRLAHRQVHVLDVFGSGFFIEQPELADSITGLRFEPFNRAHLPKNYTLPLPTEILGDAINMKTWQRLDESMRERSISSFELVVMRPEGGWREASFGRSDERSAHALKFAIGQVLSRLSPTGRFYFKIPTELYPSHATLRELVDVIETQTSHRLVLLPTADSIRRTYYLEGALLPKEEP